MWSLTHERETVRMLSLVVIEGEDRSMPRTGGDERIGILSAAGGSVHGGSVQICREFLSGHLSRSDYICQKTRSQMLQRTAVLQCTLYIRIKGGDVRRYMESIGGRLRRQVGESKAGKSLGLDKRQNGETHFFSIGGYRIASN